MKLFNNKYRVDSSRHPIWDYSANAMYFITICTYAKEHFFGDIQNGKMQLSLIGLIAEKFLADIPNHFNYAKIDEYVVMPNHVHVLLHINNQNSLVETFHHNAFRKGIEDEDIFIYVRKTLQCNTSTENKNEFMSGISPKKGSVSTIIRSYKSIVTREARKINSDFSWQERFHDHIIRNDTSYYKIKNYIKNNPENWETDTFY